MWREEGWEREREFGSDDSGEILGGCVDGGGSSVRVSVVGEAVSWGMAGSFAGCCFKFCGEIGNFWVE